MSSPVTLPYKSLIVLDRQSRIPLHQQLHHQLVALIRQGTLRPGQKMASSRELSLLLGIHRKTVVGVYEELVVQGWLQTKTASGTYVAQHLPELTPQSFVPERPARYPIRAGFAMEDKVFLHRPLVKATDGLHLDDGFPDPRLLPLEDLAKAYRRNLTLGNRYQRLGYGDTKGSLWLRQQLAGYLQATRGLNISEHNIMVVRGTVMAMYLANMAFVKPGDVVAMGGPSWLTAQAIFRQSGAQVASLPVDEHGLVVEALEELCTRLPVRMVYVTPHHDYPTTVLMRADRRIYLLRLAQQYGFIVFEDDYDYDFHYQSKPLLPLASADTHGMVLYAGSFTKSISPAFRVGYVVAPEEVIDYLAHHRRMIDRQGDNVLENAIAELLQEGTIQKYLRKAVRSYRERRDVLAALLQEHLSDRLTFQQPEGGMAIWTTFAPSVDLVQASRAAQAQGLYFSEGLSLGPGMGHGTRLGFASSEPQELEACVQILRNVLR